VTPPALQPPVARTIGVLTAAYGVSAILRPQTLARWTELGDPASPSAAVRALSTSIGVRDLCSGAAIVLAPRGRALRTALVVRATLDAGDAIVFGTLCPTRRARVTIAALAAGWGVLAAATAMRTARAGDARQAPAG
jgi:Domain of unknown function (DUF4267)